MNARLPHRHTVEATIRTKAGGLWGRTPRNNAAEPESNTKGTPGIRLFPGDFFHVDRKLGVDRSKVELALNHHPLAFHVVDESIGDRERFQKIRFETPMGVFVSTYRHGAEIHPKTAVKFEREDEDESFFPIRAGQVLVIKPASGAKECAEDLDAHGIQVSGWNDPLHKDMCLKVACSKHWKVEVIDAAVFGGKSTLKSIDEKTDIRIEDLRRAVEHRFGMGAFEELMELAKDLPKG